VRATIESGLSAPGGRLWDVQDYLQWARFRVSKKGREANRRMGVSAIESAGSVA